MDTPLFLALTRIYARENIRHPALKSATLAQWLLESGRGTSRLAQEHYNFGGLKWRAEMRPHATRVRYQAHDGADWYCKFATLESFLNGYWAFLNRAPYSGWEERADDAEEFIRFIGPIYSTAPRYADRVLALVPEAQALLDAAEAPPPEPPGEAAPSLGTVVIDPGHGGTGNLPGSSANNATSVSGVKEKKLTLDLALMLAEHLRLQAQGLGRSIDVHLTREGDVNVPGAQRAARAGETQAQALLSIHFNGFNGSARGTETYFQAAANGNENLQADQAFAKRINDAALKGIADAGLPPRNRGIKGDDQTAHRSLAVLSDRNLGNVGNPRPCAACLLEVEFIDHPEVERAIVSGPNASQARGRIAEYLAAALIEQLSPG